MSRRRGLGFASAVLLLLGAAAHAPGDAASLARQNDAVTQSVGNRADAAAPNQPVRITTGNDDTPARSADSADADTATGVPADITDSDNTAHTNNASPVTVDDEFENRRIGHDQDTAADSDKRASDADMRDTFSGMSMWLALLLVCAMIVVGAYLFRRFVPGAQTATSGTSSALQVMNRAFLSPKQSVALVRVGRRVLVVGVTADAITQLSDIQDPDEVAELVSRCEQSRATSITSSFNSLFKRQTDEFSGVSELDDEYDHIEEPAAVQANGQLLQLLTRIRGISNRTAQRGTTTRNL